MIVSGKITKIETENSKKIYLEIRLDKVLAICYNEEKLIDETTYRSASNENQLSILDEFYNNLYKFKITGYIKKHDVKLLLNFKIR